MLVTKAERKCAGGGSKISLQNTKYVTTLKPDVKTKSFSPV
jgi:hypothetical protein